MLFYKSNAIFGAYFSSRGGIGRRARLRGVWEKSRGGSTPLVSTFAKPVSFLERAFFIEGEVILKKNLRIIGGTCLPAGRLVDAHA